MMSVPVVLYLKGIHISMEYMQKSLFFCKTYNAQGARGAWGASGARVLDI